MSSNSKWWFIGIVALVLMFQVGKSSTYAKECPGPNKTPHRDGTYDFTYESWVKKHAERDHYDFGRCVQNNLSDHSMFVDWKKTHVKGWAKPKDSVDAGIESLTKDFDLVDTDLWYGSRPARINAPYREVRQQKNSKEANLRSWIRMSIPTDVSDPEKTLISIDAEFFADVLSIVTGEGVRFLYRYAWRDNLAHTRDPAAFRWRSASVQRGMKLLGVSGHLLLHEALNGIILR